MIIYYLFSFSRVSIFRIAITAAVILRVQALLGVLMISLNRCVSWGHQGPYDQCVDGGSPLHSFYLFASGQPQRAPEGAEIRSMPRWLSSLSPCITTRHHEMPVLEHRACTQNHWRWPSPLE